MVIIYLLIFSVNSLNIKPKYVKPFPKISYTKIHPVYYPNNIFRKKIKKPYAAKFFKEIIFNNLININNIFILINTQLYNTSNTCNIYNLTNINL